MSLKNIKNRMMVKKEVTLPISKMKVTFRPFTVAEEKILMMAKESGKFQEIVSSSIEMLKACTGIENPSSLPIADIEYLFTRIRMLSKGEAVNLSFRCRNPVEREIDGEKKTMECGHINEISIPLDDIAPKYKEGYTDKIEVTGTDFVLKFRPPSYEFASSVSELEKLPETVTETELKIMIMEKIFVETLECVFDKSTEEVFYPENEKESLELLQTLPSNVYEDLEEKFWKKLPVISYDLDFCCESCGHREKIHLEGLQDFFE